MYIYIYIYIHIYTDMRLGWQSHHTILQVVHTRIWLKTIWEPNSFLDILHIKKPYHTNSNSQCFSIHIRCPNTLVQQPLDRHSVNQYTSACQRPPTTTEVLRLKLSEPGQVSQNPSMLPYLISYPRDASKIWRSLNCLAQQETHG